MIQSIKNLFCNENKRISPADPIPIDVDGQSPILLTLPRAYSSEAESVELRFKVQSELIDQNPQIRRYK